MSDRHFELPAHPGLEYYRKQSKYLQHMYSAGDAAAQARVADVLGDRSTERFLLSAADFVPAQEHGFGTWAEFRAHIQSRSATGYRLANPQQGLGPGAYASVDVLLTELRYNVPDTLQRLRAKVARHAATEASIARASRRSRSSTGSSASRPGGSLYRSPVSPCTISPNARRSSGA